jgi:enterochelin esterase family protein
VWKSRPPGGRGLILVEDRLVIFGGLGALVVARATPEGYVEEARIQALEHSGYVWPSYAAGHVYLRNSAELVCVALVPPAPTATELAESAASEEETAVAAAPKADAGQDLLARWMVEVEATPRIERVLLVESLFEQHPTSPILDGNRVHVLWRGEAEDVALLGSMNADGRATPMSRVDGTDLWVKSFDIEDGARWEYAFQVDYGPPLLDPRNPRSVPATFGEGMSEIATPGYDPEGHWLADPPDSPGSGESRGRLESFEFTSETLGNTRTLQAWLPPGYDEGDASYPLLLIHDGEDWMENGGLANSLDHLVGKSVRPLVAVFIAPMDEWWFEAGGTGTDAYLEMLAREMLPALEKRYRLSRAPADRALLGMRSFGMTAAYGPLLFPQVFGKAGLQSVNQGDITRHAIFERLGRGAPPGAVYYLDWNRYEMRNPDRATDIAGDCKRLFDALEKAGVTVRGGEVLDAYGWGGWRARNDDLLQALFPME